MFLSNICRESGFLSTMLFIKSIEIFVSILIPLILIVSLGFEITTMVYGDVKNYHKHVRSIILKTIAAVVIFFIPTITNVTLSLVSQTKFSATECWTNANTETIERYKAVEEAQAKLEEEKRAKEAKKAEEMRIAIEKTREAARKENEKKAEEERRRKQQEGAGGGSGGQNDCKGSYSGTKYNLSQYEITGLARMVTCEYGTDANGMSAVASHMANLYEIRNHYGNTGGRSLYQYITTCGWYACARKLGDSSYDNSQAQQVVRSVLVEGKRTLPLYIDEFDWYPHDIKGATWESYKSYTPHVTQLNNVYSSSGKYFCITISGHDGNVFFYTATAERYKNEKNL